MYTYGPCHSFLICSNREFIPDSRNCDRHKEGHTLLTDKDFPVHPLLFLQPTRSQEGFIKAKSPRLLKSNSSERLLNENMNKFKSRLRAIGYPDTLVERIPCDVKFSERRSAPQQRERNQKTSCVTPLCLNSTTS